MTSKGSTEPQPSALRKTPIWTSQSSLDSARSSRPIAGRLTPPWALAMVCLRARPGLRGRRGLEDRPGDLGSVVRLFGRVERADDVVLADRALHPDRPLRDDASERGVRAVDVVDRAGVNRDRVLDARKQQLLDAYCSRPRRRFDGEHGDDLAELILEQLARVERCIRAGPAGAGL